MTKYVHKQKQNEVISNTNSIEYKYDNYFNKQKEINSYNPWIS